MFYAAPLYSEQIMKKKNTILLCFVTAFLLALAGVTVMLCMGCDTDTAPDGTIGETTAGDQITEETLTEGDSTSAADPETDGDTTPEESQTSSSETAADESAEPSEPETDTPDEPEDSATDPEETTAEASANPEPITFEAYHALSSAEQEDYFWSFATPDDFFAWYNAAKEKYQEENPGVEIGPGGAFPIP